MRWRAAEVEAELSAESFDELNAAYGKLIGGKESTTADDIKYYLELHVVGEKLEKPLLFATPPCIQLLRARFV